MPPVSRKPGKTLWSHPLPGDKDYQGFMGVDPGESGAVAVLLPGNKLVTHKLKNSTLEQTWNFLRKYGVPAVRSLDYRPGYHAVIEEIQPRPTSYFDKSLGQWKSTIIRSTCLIYASYQQLLGLLVAAGIPYYTAVPQRWMNDMRLPKKDKNEEDRVWKNTLKKCAQEMFPNHKITLGDCDAVLLARYAKLRWTGV